MPEAVGNIVRRFPGLPWIVAIVTIVGATYLATLLPGVGYHPDTARFQFVGKVLGTPHPTGYPTYLMLNHVFVTWFPLGTLAWRANLLSAVFGVVALGLFWGLARSLGARASIAAASALILGFTPTFWSQAIVAEVYTLHAVFVVLLLWFGVRALRPGDEIQATPSLVTLALSFGHHMTTVTLLPAMAWSLWHEPWRRWLTPRRLLGLLGVAVLAAVPYLYLFWRTAVPQTPYLETSVRSLADLFAVVSGARARRSMFAFSPGELLTERIPLFAELAWQQLGPILVVVGLGVFALGRSRRGVFLALAGLGPLLWALNYDILDVEVYFLPVWIVAAAYLAVGFEWLAARHLKPAWISLLVVVVPTAVAASHFRNVDQSATTSHAELVAATLEVVGRDALIVPAVRHQGRYFQYFLVGEGLGRERQIYVVWPPKLVVGYLEGQPTRPDRQPEIIPPNLTVYAFAPAHRRLTQLGFDATEILPPPYQLYRIETKQQPDPSQQVPSTRAPTADRSEDSIQ